MKRPPASDEVRAVALADIDGGRSVADLAAFYQHDSSITRQRRPTGSARTRPRSVRPSRNPSSPRSSVRTLLTARGLDAHKKLVWRTKRRASVIAFWMAFSAVIIIVGRLVRESWVRYCWETSPARRP
jgi:hypothetical protein